MAEYTNIIGRPDVASALLPDQIINEIIQESPKASVMLNRAKRVTLSSAKAKQPVLATLPSAYWVDGDTGLKQTTAATWNEIYITAEELAVIVPIPNALVDDANVPLWSTVRPLLTEAIGKKIDEATLFGIDKPASWPVGVFAGAMAAGNYIIRGTGTDLGQDVATLSSMIAKQGYGVNGFASAPGLQWELVGLRASTGVPIYTANLSGQPESGLYGYPLQEVMNGAWENTTCTLIAADWSKFIIGVRQDITFDMFSEGVISDDDGKVILNLIQQDTKALRVVFRVGFQTAIPVTRVGTETRYPAGVLVSTI